MIAVSSKILRNSISGDREWPAEIPESGIVVTREQLETAARLLEEAEPSRIDYPKRERSTIERPGFLEEQKDPNVLDLTIGVLGTEKYKIARDGAVL